VPYDPPKHILLRRQTEVITDRDLGFLEVALREQLRQAALLYGLPAPGVTLVTPDTHLPTGEAVAIDFVDSDGLPDGIAHHGWNPGASFAWCLVGCKEAGWAWSVAASHEALEYLVNLRLDRWVAESEDEEAYWAMEIADPVEEDHYAMAVARFGERRAVQLSNYVYPDFWVPGSAGPWDKLRKLKGPFSLSHGGYAIVERPSGLRIPIGGGARRGTGANRATSRAAYLLTEKPPAAVKP
jgi:hypothetical protein